MTRSVTVLLAMALMAALSTAAAQPRTAYPDKRGFQKADFPRIVKIAENVYGYEDFHNAGMMTVSMFVVGRDGVMLVDGQGSPAATARLVEAITKTTGKPIKWYVVGSDHGDHTAGNAVLPSAVTYIVHPTSHAQLQRDAANAKAAHEKASAEAAAQGKPAPTPRVVVVPPMAMSADKQV